MGVQVPTGYSEPQRQVMRSLKLTAVGSRPRLHIPSHVLRPIPWSSYGRYGEYGTEIAADGIPKPASAMMERPVLLPATHSSPCLQSLSFSPPVPFPVLPRLPGLPILHRVFRLSRLAALSTRGFLQCRRDLYHSRGPGLGTRHNAVYMTTHLWPVSQLFSVVVPTGTGLWGGGRRRSELKCPKK